MPFKNVKIDDMVITDNTGAEISIHKLCELEIADIKGCFPIPFNDNQSYTFTA